MIWFRSALYFVLLSVSVLLFSSLLLLLARFVRQNHVDTLVQTWACLNVWLQKVVCGLGYEVDGREHLVNLPAIVMVKHQSTWETFALPCVLPATQSWVLKKELLNIPFFGWALGVFRSIPIDRQAGRRAIIQLVRDGQHNLHAGRSVIIFPEGTRTQPGQRGKYNIGGALLAVQSRTDVIPIAHNGGVYWSAGGFKKYPGTIQVRIGPPISVAGKTSEAVMTEVEAWIEAEMDALPTQR